MNLKLTDLVRNRLSELMKTDWTQTQFSEILTTKIFSDLCHEQILCGESLFRDLLVEIGFFIDEDTSCVLTNYGKNTYWVLKGSEKSIVLSTENIIEYLNVII